MSSQPSLEHEHGHPLAGVRMTGADVVVQVLADEGVDTVFGYSGGAILPTYDAVFRYNDEHRDADGKAPIPLVVPANDPAWKQLFVYAIGNHLMFPRPHRPPPPADEVIRREEWLKERRGIGGLFEQIGNEALNMGSGKVDLGLRFKLALKAMEGPVRERDLDGEAREAKIAYERETIDEEEANWLIARLRRDGDLHENARALLTFIRNTSPNIHSSLDKFMTEAGI